MIVTRPANERGHFNHGWLDTYHTFSFADYHDPKHMGWGSLRVINDDTVAPGRGFSTHGHRDMEILSYVLDGALEHRDSTGSGSVLRPGDVQRMSAGTGVMHSEFNHSKEESVHFLQIWIYPEEKGLAPGYEEKSFPNGDKKGRLRLIASPDARDGSLKIHQDVKVFASILAADDKIEHRLEPGRNVWIQIARGRLKLNDSVLKKGDGAAVTDETSLVFQGIEDVEFLLFDLAQADKSDDR
jgi:redox-sensitive bicupin YhaK (pirin superfamily)